MLLKGYLERTGYNPRHTYYLVTRCSTLHAHIFREQLQHETRGRVLVAWRLWFKQRQATTSVRQDIHSSRGAWFDAKDPTSDPLDKI